MRAGTSLIREFRALAERVNMLVPVVTNSKSQRVKRLATGGYSSG
jgi:hypothetical protein